MEPLSLSSLLAWIMSSTSFGYQSHPHSQNPFIVAVTVWPWTVKHRRIWCSPLISAWPGVKFQCICYNEGSVGVVISFGNLFDIICEVCFAPMVAPVSVSCWFSYQPPGSDGGSCGDCSFFSPLWSFYSEAELRSIWNVDTSHPSLILAGSSIPLLTSKVVYCKVLHRCSHGLTPTVTSKKAAAVLW